jgi:hypothetical protein
MAAALYMYTSLFVVYLTAARPQMKARPTDQKGCGKKLQWPILRYYPTVFLEGQVKPGKPQSEQPARGPRFEPVTI